MSSSVAEPVVAGKTGLAKEPERALRQMRAVLNQSLKATAKITTAQTNTATAIWTGREMSQRQGIRVEAIVEGYSADGSVYATYDLVAIFHRAATGDGAQVGSTQPRHTAIESNGALDCTISMGSDSKPVVKVNDGNQGTVDWGAWVEVRTL